ncbi:MAG: hypothetical protein R3E68_13155 [Burkholderiaceae bacterium]
MKAALQETRPQAVSRGAMARLIAGHGLGPILVALGAAAAILILTVWPMIWLVIGSLTQKQGYGLGRYRELVDKFAFADVLLNSWVYALGTALSAMLIGVTLAVLVARTDMPFKRTARLLAILAFVSPPWLTAMAMRLPRQPERGFHQRIAVLHRRREALPMQTTSG